MRPLHKALFQTVKRLKLDPAATFREESENALYCATIWQKTWQKNFWLFCEFCGIISVFFNIVTLRLFFNSVIIQPFQNKINKFLFSNEQVKSKLVCFSERVWNSLNVRPYNNKEQLLFPASSKQSQNFAENILNNLKIARFI